jgi:membrane protease subunit (stomatin/prohibitin family)
LAEKIRFTRNYSDNSTDRGFQFEFNCDRCGTGFRTPFRAWMTGTVTSAIDAAGDLLGGIFSRGASLGHRVRSAGWQKAHDEALKEAVAEVMPSFIQCPRCQAWVCRERCWNNTKGLCKNCAPDLGVEMSAAQSSRSVEEVWRHAAMAEEDKKLATEYWRETIVASCPNCGASLERNVKFCPECGQRLLQEKFCSECGEKMSANAKFCPSCGAKAEQ